MAKLEIELSEYDAMREARRAAETRVTELQEEIRDLKKGSKVILRRETEYLCLAYDTIQFEQTLRKRIEQAPYGITFEGRPRLNLSMIATLCIKTLEELPKKYLRQISPSEEYPTCSDTLIGFEDIRLKVEDIFKEEFKRKHQQALNDLQLEKDKYTEEYSQIQEKLSKEFKEIIENLQEKVKGLTEENSSLKEQLEKASKSTEEKIAEAEAKVKAAQEELASLKGKKHWWQKK
jgi:predicted  nucleic acid-binding Zn-ribbon protein